MTVSYKYYMTKTLLKNKTYKLIDFIKIPLEICPFYTSLKIINKVILALIPSLQVLVTASFIDTALAIVNNGVEKNRIYMPLVLIMFIILYTNINWQVMSYINLKFEMRMTRVYRTAIVEKRAKLEYRHIENNDTWELISRTCADPVGRIQKGFDNILDIASIIIRVMSLLIIIMTQVWWAGFAIIAISIPLFFLSIKAGKKTYEANKSAEKHRRRAKYLQSVLIERDNIEERSLFNYSHSVNKLWYEKYESARKIELKVDLKYYVRIKFASLITVFISLFIIGVLLFPLAYAQITAGMFISLVITTLDVVKMMSWQLSYIMSRLTNNKEYLKDLSKFYALSEIPGALDLPNDVSTFEFEDIEFKNVSFKYPGVEKNILNNFSLRLEKNLHYAFVGVNGAGKTTITKLLTGMYDNFEGEIFINGKNIREYSQSDLKAIFAVVYQDFAKYYIPMKDNIALGNVLEFNEEIIKKQASIIGLDEVIYNLSDGMDTWLGKIKENGVDLSGGEWQRVAIARTLYNPACVRILDEPTAALDPVAESNIYEMFSKISTGKSTIFITHRLGAARLADEIIVIDDGMVKEKGNHENLMENKGIYAQMFEAQRSWYQC